jgi:hypothetical protein
LAAPAPASDVQKDRWDFNVFLNEKKVGKHSFEVVRSGDAQTVESNADFRYKILFIPAYRYEHSNSEQWSNDCLLGFDAQTNANGKYLEVSGRRDGGYFTVQGADGADKRLPECVMSFAYWNPDFLDQSRLLNPQTGEYIDVSVEQFPEETLEVRGKPVTATRFRVTAYEVDLMLWYSSDKRWLALESVAKGGHVIRYELS